MSEEPVVLSAEQLWAVSNEEYEQFRGEPVEVTDFEHKIAKDLKEFSKNIDEDKIDNVTFIRDGTSKDEYSDDENDFFDRVEVTPIKQVLDE